MIRFEILFRILLPFIFLSGMAQGQSVFIPENGKYIYRQTDILSGIPYISLSEAHPGYVFKLDKKRNEYQAKNWFQKDWYRMQDMYKFDEHKFVTLYGGGSFNEAKRKQYSGFAFNKKNFYHFKTIGVPKEWGGLTHPPMKTLSGQLENYHAGFAPIDYQSVNSNYFDSNLQLSIDADTGSELSYGNVVLPFADHAVFLLKKKLISEARESILMSSLVFVCDTGTREIVDLLIRKHKEGLQVKILTDGMIGKLLRHRECLKLMREAGIEVLETKDFFKHKLKAIYHTKVLVTDIKEAVAGGHNMIDADNLSHGTDFKNRDVDLYVKGPMVTDVAKSFLENWQYQRTLQQASSLNDLRLQVKQKLIDEYKSGLRGKALYASILSNPVTRMKGVCRFIRQSPFEDGVTIGKGYLRLLDHVKKHLVITDPIKTDTYSPTIKGRETIDMLDSFEMFNKLYLRVQKLARNGLPIDYITTNITMAGNENVAIMNERIRGKLEEGKNLAANWSLAKLLLTNNYYGGPHYRNLMKDWLPIPNVHVWNHISFMHSKIFYFDRIVASVGSYNFQHNATDQAYESTAVCMDEKLNQELDKILVQDMANSIPLIFSQVR